MHALIKKQCDVIHAASRLMLDIEKSPDIKNKLKEYNSFNSLKDHLTKGLLK
tara:strand:+ start:1268 stop:1423 length:156 start_codon:yes stop_codon:yes gene_type:complete